jgi:hypothetical protein
MRPMTLNSSSGFQRSISVSCFLLLFLVCTEFSIGKSNEKSTNDSINNYEFYSKQNTIIDISDDSVYAIIIKNNKSCINCFQVLSDYLINLSKENKIELHAVSHSDSTSLARKRNIYELTMLFPDFNRFNVTYSNEWDDKTPSPELVIIKNKIFYRFSYRQLFAEGFSFISSSVQTKIKNIINSE